MTVWPHPEWLDRRLDSLEVSNRLPDFLCACIFLFHVPATAAPFDKSRVPAELLAAFQIKS
jgi:hypothetical protein